MSTALFITNCINFSRLMSTRLHFSTWSTLVDAVDAVDAVNAVKIHFTAFFITPIIYGI